MLPNIKEHFGGNLLFLWVLHSFKIQFGCHFKYLIDTLGFIEFLNCANQFCLEVLSVRLSFYRKP